MEKYAYEELSNLIIKIGINLQKGQDVKIFSSVNQVSFVKILTEKLYLSGARKVDIEFHDEDITRLKYQYQSLETLLDIPESEILSYKERSEKLPCLIYLEDDNPDIFDGLDGKKIVNAKNYLSSKIKQYRDIESMNNQWLIVALPSKGWAKKVYPNDDIDIAYQKLEDAILKIMRIKKGEDTVDKWIDHINALKRRADYLNKLDLDYLHYTSSNGTDLILHLNENHKWLSAESINYKNIPFCANLPTEEVFTMPSRNKVDGIVYSTKPLSLNGKVINDFSILFKDGKVISCHAKENEEALKELILSDEGASHLGEVALVGYSSPINQINVLFYNTLFDENASCHLALGRGYEDTFRNYQNMSREDMIKNGYNDSLIHVDFMIGNKDLSIIGYDKKGKKYSLFENGDFSFNC